MEKFFESITNGDTGEVTIRHYTEEEIAAVMAARARENVPDQISARQARLLILSKNKTIGSEASSGLASRLMPSFWPMTL